MSRKKDYIKRSELEHFTISNLSPFKKNETIQIKHGTSFLQLATVNFVDTLKKCNSTIDFSKLNSRPLTSPSLPCGNNGKDNINNDLILYTEHVIGTGVDPLQTVGKNVNSKYRLIGTMGCGQFGQVIKAFDEQNQREVAIKILKNRPAYMRQGMLEIAILQLLNDRFDHDGSCHTLRLYDHFIFDNHICIVTELLGMNLFELLKQKNYTGLSVKLTINILKQLAESLNVLYNNNIIHCDLKPENILLVDQTVNIRLIDFGSSCFENCTMYNYIQSRHYRSPEVILGIKYNTLIDMWSFGCIAAELILGIPIFPGSSEYNQLERIIKMIGNPPKYLLDQGTNTRKYFKKEANGWVFKTRNEFETENNVKLEPFRNYYNYQNLEQFTDRLGQFIRNQQTLTYLKPSYLDFLKRTLSWDPDIRLTPSQALQHPFLKNIKLPYMYQPPNVEKPTRTYPGDCILSADDALKIICPQSMKPSKMKTQIYTTTTYYQVFMTALENNIVLDITTANPFIKSPMTPPVLAWEEVHSRRHKKEHERKKKFIQETDDKYTTGSYTSGKAICYKTDVSKDYYKSPVQSWSKYHPLLLPKDN